MKAFLALESPRSGHPRAAGDLKGRPPTSMSAVERIGYSYPSQILPLDYPFRTPSPSLADYLFITEGSE